MAEVVPQSEVAVHTGGLASYVAGPSLNYKEPSLPEPKHTPAHRSQASFSPD